MATLSDQNGPKKQEIDLDDLLKKSDPMQNSSQNKDESKNAEIGLLEKEKQEPPSKSTIKTGNKHKLIGILVTDGVLGNLYRLQTYLLDNWPYADVRQVSFDEPPHERKWDLLILPSAGPVAPDIRGLNSKIPRKLPFCPAYKWFVDMLLDDIWFNANIPILGIDTGALYLASKLGAQLEYCEGHMKCRHKITGIDLLGEKTDISITAESQHTQAIQILGEKMHSLHYSDGDEYVESFVSQNGKIHGVMWRPEINFHKKGSYMYREYNLQIGDPIVNTIISNYLDK